MITAAKARNWTERAVNSYENSLYDLISREIKEAASAGSYSCIVYLGICHYSNVIKLYEERGFKVETDGNKTTISWGP